MSAAANKGVIGDSGIIEGAATLLKSSYDIVQPLQHNVVGLLKHLCAQHLPNALRVIALLPPILDLIERIDDVRLRTEATRILANVSRTLWNSKLETIDATGRDAARAALADSPGAANALAEMVRTGDKYPILVNEGIGGLVVIATLPAGAVHVVAALAAEHRSTSLPSHVNGSTAAAYAPSPATTAAMPFSARNDAVGPRANGSLPPSRQSTLSTGDRDPTRPPKPKPTSAALALAAHLGNPALPVEIRANACALVEVLAGQVAPSATGMPVVRKAVGPALEGIATTAVGAAGQPTLRMAAERAWRRLQAA
jgi:hypothetical protein